MLCDDLRAPGVVGCENILFVPPFTRKTVDRNEAFRAYAHEAFQTRTAI